MTLSCGNFRQVFSPNLIGALTTLFFTNCCVRLKSDREIGRLTVIGFFSRPQSSEFLQLARVEMLEKAYYDTADIA